LVMRLPTLLKQGKNRVLVAAVLGGTGAGDEDIVQVHEGEG
jgi:hypothetical protein